jgi:copper chaperone CopZ
MMSKLRVDPGTRKRGEFERRTAIFEGAYRAWSFLGGLEPEDIVGPSSSSSASSQAVEADLLDRLFDYPSSVVENDGRSRKTYPFEPLPRVGLSHPYVQAILTPWLGPDTDKQVQKASLQSLRVWWQHRKVGESRTAATAFRKEAKQNVVDGYTRIFFRYAYCLVAHDNVQPPKSLFLKRKALEKQQQQGQPKKIVKTAEKSACNMTSPLAHLVQSKCVPSKVDLPAVVDAIDRQVVVQSSVHRGSDVLAIDDHVDTTTPVVFCSSNGDVQIVMTVDGIVCAHCVKIVETVLRGCDGRKSPIDGLLDAAVDAAVDRRDTLISTILIKIDRVSNAKRIAFEAARNLSLVGYIAKAKAMNFWAGEGSQKHGRRTDDVVVSTAFEAVAVNNNNNGPISTLFDWALPCNCPDHGVFYCGSCQRHSQGPFSRGVLAAFTEREQQVKEYLETTGHAVNGVDLDGRTTSRAGYEGSIAHTVPTSPPLTELDQPSSWFRQETLDEITHYQHQEHDFLPQLVHRPSAYHQGESWSKVSADQDHAFPVYGLLARSWSISSDHQEHNYPLLPVDHQPQPPTYGHLARSWSLSSDLDGFINTMNWNGLDDGFVFDKDILDECMKK